MLDYSECGGHRIESTSPRLRSFFEIGRSCRSFVVEDLLFVTCCNFENIVSRGIKPQPLATQSLNSRFILTSDSVSTA